MALYRPRLQLEADQNTGLRRLPEGEGVGLAVLRGLGEIILCEPKQGQVVRRELVAAGHGFKSEHFAAILGGYYNLVVAKQEMHVALFCTLQAGEPATAAVLGTPVDRRQLETEIRQGQPLQELLALLPD